MILDTLNHVLQLLFIPVMESNNDHLSLIHIIDDLNSKGKVPAAAQTNVSRYKKLRASKNETIAKVKQTVEMLNSDASMIDLNALGDLLGKIKQLTEKEVGLEADIRKLLAGAESEKKKLVEPEQEPEAEPEMIRAEPASATGRTSESLSVQKSSGSKKRKKPAQEVNSQGETLWCHCRRPEFGKMVACDGKHCRHEWFHVGCVGYKDGDEQNTKKWLCKDCKQLLKIARNYILM